MVLDVKPADFTCPYSAALTRCRNRLDPMHNEQKYAGARKVIAKIVLARFALVDKSLDAGPQLEDVHLARPFIQTYGVV